MSQKKTNSKSLSPIKVAASLSLFIVSATLIPFQNCSQVDFISEDALKAPPVDRFSVPGSAIVKAGSEENFPPLKLVFVVDNSGTMKVNQINLSSAFSSMFDGDNATNLVPFDTTAYVISTAQKSLPQSSSVWANLPQNSPQDLLNYSFQDLQALRGGAKTDGKLPGDLVGYGVTTSMESGLKTVNFIPSPVIDFAPDNGKSSISLGVRKEKDGSVSRFAQDFSNRLAVLDPNRPNLVNGKVPLDQVVDSESGLCALARTLKHNNGILNRGDLAAYIIVSDEEESDANGRNCIDQYVDLRGDQDLVDGSCMQPYTKLTYQPANPNPEIEKCKVSYVNRIKYALKYDKPQTTVSWHKWVHTYNRPQVSIAYHLHKHKYDSLKTKIDYQTRSTNPTYQMKRSRVNYTRKVEVCAGERDGVKIDCAWTYPSAFVEVDGDHARIGCSAIAQGKLAGDADLSKGVSCQNATASTPRSGACPSNPDAFNCLVNESFATNSQTFDGRPSGATQANCDSYASGKIPSGSLSPKCFDASAYAQIADGKCPTDNSKPGCLPQHVAASKPVVVDGILSGSNCATLYANKLEANAVTDVDGKNPVCSQGTPSLKKDQAGKCPTSNDPMKADCANGYAKQSDKTVANHPENSSYDACVAIAGVSNETNVVLNDSTKLTCTPKMTNTLADGEIYFSDSKFPANYDPAEGSSCMGLPLEGVIRTAKSVAANHPTTECKVTNRYRAEETYIGSCSQQASSNYCTSSNNHKRNCDAGTSIPGGSPYLAAVTESKPKTFTCNSTCAEAGLACQGVVRDSFYGCQTTPDNARKTKDFNAELASNSLVCPTGQQKVVTKGPYRSEELGKPRYVAGQLSESNDSSALEKYIGERSDAIFGKNNLPSVSVFVRQPGDATGQNGSIGAKYNTFADKMGGQKKSVLSDATGYASSLKMLAGTIREKLNRSFSIEIGPKQNIVRAYHRKAGQQQWSPPVDPSLWSASGGTVTMDPALDFSYGDEFKFDYE